MQRSRSCEPVGVGVAAALAQGKGKLQAAAWFSGMRVVRLSWC